MRKKEDCFFALLRCCRIVLYIIVYSIVYCTFSANSPFFLEICSLLKNYLTFNS